MTYEWLIELFLYCQSFHLALLSIRFIQHGILVQLSNYFSNANVRFLGYLFLSSPWLVECNWFRLVTLTTSAFTTFCGKDACQAKQKRKIPFSLDISLQIKASHQS